MLKAIIILPFNVLVVFPTIILYFSEYAMIKIGMSLQFFSMIMLFIIGFSLCGWTMKMFYKTGSGSPAPWNPIKTLLISGPYAYVRNPMLSGVFIILLGEVLLFQSLAIFYYLVLFITINAIYFPLSEEKGLLKRYGADYKEYKENVPRFIPRLTAWKK